MHFPADNFANETLSLTRSNDRSIVRRICSRLACAETVTNKAKEARIGFSPGRKVSIRERGSSGSLIFGAMIHLGSLEAGAVAHWLGTPFALALGGIVCAISALVALLVIQRREAQLAK